MSISYKHVLPKRPRYQDYYQASNSLFEDIYNPTYYFNCRLPQIGKIGTRITATVRLV